MLDYHSFIGPQYSGNRQGEMWLGVRIMSSQHINEHDMLGNAWYDLKIQLVWISLHQKLGCSFLLPTYAAGIVWALLCWQVPAYDSACLWAGSIAWHSQDPTFCLCIVYTNQLAQALVVSYCFCWSIVGVGGCKLANSWLGLSTPKKQLSQNHKDHIQVQIPIFHNTANTWETNIQAILQTAKANVPTTTCWFWSCSPHGRLGRVGWQYCYHSSQNCHCLRCWT